MRMQPLLFAIAVCASASLARADPALPPAEEIVQRVNARDEGEAVTRTWIMELVEKDGSSRSRTLRSYRRRFGDARRSVLFFEEPPNVKGTALLTFDYDDPAQPDDQWLYLPALRKSRRVALADRGRSFIGSDFSFDDMKRETQLSAVDYRWRTLGEESVDGHRCVVLEAIAVDARVARELGHDRALVRIDTGLWFPRFVEYFDADGTPLKSIRLHDVAQIQQIWTAQRIEAEDLATGHRTTLHFRDVDYQAQIAEDQFSEAAMRRGAP
jgi:outer membrane lipoprotein-sorting protein